MTLAIGAYSASQIKSCMTTVSRAAFAEPGGGISPSSRAANTTLPKTRRIGWEKLEAVYWIAGFGSGKPQSQAGARRRRSDARRWIATEAIDPDSSMKANTRRPL